MSPIFGGRAKDEGQARPGVRDLEAALERLGSLSLPQLAAEVMAKGFGPGSPGADEDESVTVTGGEYRGGPGIVGIATAVAREFYARSTDVGINERLALQNRLCRLVAEGLQALEHASLIITQFHGNGGVDYALTRRGRVALERDEVERLLA